MPSKKKPSEDRPAITPNLIPEISDVLIPGDPGDPSSRPIFMPYKLGLDKEGDGAFKLSHRGAGSALNETELEIIFLYVPKETQCRCTEKADRKRIVCYSLSREYSTKGHKCKEECPYAEAGVPAESKLYTRPLRKTAYILFRKAGTEDAFNLARYNSVMNNINDLETLKSVFHQRLNADHIPNPAPSYHVALIEANAETTPSGSKVGRFGKKVYHVAELTPEAFEKVKKLNAALEALQIKTVDDSIASALRERAKLKAAQASRPAATAERPRTEPTSAAPAERAAAAGSGTAPASHPASGSIPDAATAQVADPAAVEDLTDPEEDDLPF